MHRCRHRPLGFQIILVAFQHDKPFSLGFKYCLYHPPLAFAVCVSHSRPTFLPGCQLLPCAVTLHESKLTLSTHHSWRRVCHLGDTDLSVMFEYVSSFSSRWLQILSSVLAHSPPVRKIGLHVSQRPRFFCLFFSRPFYFHICLCNMKKKSKS